MSENTSSRKLTECCLENRSELIDAPEASLEKTEIASKPDRKMFMRRSPSMHTLMQQCISQARRGGPKLNIVILHFSRSEVDLPRQSQLAAFLRKFSESFICPAVVLTARCAPQNFCSTYELICVKKIFADTCHLPCMLVHIVCSCVCARRPCSACVIMIVFEKYVSVVYVRICCAFDVSILPEGEPAIHKGIRTVKKQ